MTTILFLFFKKFNTVGGAEITYRHRVVIDKPGDRLILNRKTPKLVLDRIASE